MWTPLESTHTTASSKILMRCKCGVEKLVRVNDVISGGSKGCRECRLKEARQARDPEAVKAQAKRASQASAEKQKARTAARYAKYPDWDVVYFRMSGAKNRCTNTNEVGYKNYGGRGIEFRFPNLSEATIWVLDNLGAPKPGESIDRIDNNGHYEPGNLRWATQIEQARNKRAYKRNAEGARKRRLHAMRPDLTPETIRIWIKKGLTDDEILRRKKYEYTKQKTSASV